MPHIDLITPEQAQNETAELYETVQSAFGVIPEPMQLFSHHPRTAKAVFEGFTASMATVSLSQPFFTWLRYLLADHTNCTHCVDVNAGMLLEMGVSQDDLIAAKADPASTPLSDKEKALLLTCLKAVSDRQLLAKAEIDHLKSLGFSDAELVAAIHHAAHSQAVDLMINAFGL